MGLCEREPENGAVGPGAATYYLSLGDSLSTGVQPIGPESWQFRTDQGYADQLAELTRPRLPGLQVVKLGYPGESTTTMIDGSLGEYPHGSQLAEAGPLFFGDRGGGAVFFFALRDNSI